MESFFRDLRYAVRSLARSPGLVAAAVLSLALGIGANTTIFSAIDVFIFRPLPYPHAERIVNVWTTNASRGWQWAPASMPDALEWRARAHTLDVAPSYGATFNMGGERPERFEGARVGWNYFRVLGVAPAMGRIFLPEEETKGRDRVVVISNELWRRRFAGDPGIVGRTLLINGERHTVVGVMPPGFRTVGESDVWAPLGLDGKEARDTRYVRAMARLRPGSTFEAAQAEIAGVASQLAAQYPEDQGNGARIVTLRDDLYDATFRRATMIVSAAVLFVLLIACANVANLLLARAASREKEIALRTALGAGRLRLARQFLIESSLLGLAGGALGLLLSVWGIRGLVAIMPPEFFGVERIGIDGRVLAFTIGISLAAGLLFGTAPAIQAASPNLKESLTEGGRGATVGFRRGRLRAALVVTEIALALVLLVSAGLLVKSYLGMRRTDLGFEPRHVVTFRVSLPQSTYGDSTRAIAFYDQLLQRVRAVPGVQAAGASTTLPMRGSNSSTYWIDGQPEPPDAEKSLVPFRVVTPGYLEAMRIRVVRGRPLTDQDRTGAAPVLVVNESFARRHWAGGDPIGRRVAFTAGAREIVGVVRDTRDFGPDDDAPAVVYLPELQSGARTLSVAVRSDRDPGSLIPALRAEVQALDADQPIYDAGTMEEIVVRSIAGDTIMGRLLSLFAGIALVMAVMGVYGVMAYSVAQRTREVGVRMALGAQPRDIVRLVLRQGTFLAGLGILIGLLVAAGVTRLLAAFLHGVSAFDPLTFGLVSVSLAAAALLASLLPARRATRVDPLVALQTE
ncbi:MAG TPA: ABC transporter permease [Longimicrobiales bacterium]|nr:ABC transporter permease [Longimicrobiales bacterium]